MNVDQLLDSAIGIYGDYPQIIILSTWLIRRNLIYLDYT